MMRTEHDRDKALMQEMGTAAENDGMVATTESSPDAPATADPARSLPSWSSAWPWIQDVVAALALLWPLMWFSDNDGGRVLEPMAQYVAYLLVAIPVLAGEVRRLPKLGRFLVWAVPLGALISFAFAWDRALFVQDAQVFGAMPVVALAAARLWRREHGHLVLAGIVAVAWAAWFWNGMLLWWGWTDLGLQPRWELVSWRNQSGILSGAFGLIFLGVALVGRRSAALVASVLAASAFAGTWLSSSRGAVVFVVVVALGTLAGAWLAGARDLAATRSLLGRSAAVAIGTVVVVAALLTMLPDGSVTPLESRSQTSGQGAAHNAVARTRHWEAAVGMFFERPLVGQGLGSYRGMATRHTPTDANLTASTHNEWLEPFAEGGIILGIPMLLLGAGLLVGLRRVPGAVRAAVELEDADADPDEEPGFALRAGMLLGLVSGGLAVAAHTAIDFDLRYPVLTVLMMTGAGVLASVWSPDAGEADDDGAGPAVRTGTVALMLVPVVALGVLATWSAWRTLEGAKESGDVSPVFAAQHIAPWDTLRRINVTERLVDGGELDAARLAAEELLDWNPGNPQAEMNLARVDLLLGNVSADEVVDKLELPPTWLGEWVRTAQTLAQTQNYGHAEAVARRATEFFPEYRRWGITATVADAWIIRIEVAQAVGLCREVPGLVAEAEAQDFDAVGGAIAAVRTAGETLCPSEF